jgi:glucose/arabinose dehydrogenase
MIVISRSRKCMIYYFTKICLLSFIFLLSINACYKVRGHYGGKQNFDPQVRKMNTADIALPSGYKIEAVASNLTYPTGAAFDEDGNLYVIEAGYSYGEVFLQPKLLKIEANGKTTEIAAGGNNGPWTGITFYDGSFYIAEGGALDGGRILKISKDGNVKRLIENLPSKGDHHTNGPAIGNDGYLYFGQGTTTNSGVVGEDNYEFGWLKRNPGIHDIPCSDIILKGQNFESNNPLTPDEHDKISTGAYSPFGTSTRPGQIVKGNVPCNGSIMRIPLEGGTPEVFAWGLRNPFGLAFSPEGKLFVTENAYDTRGSRPGYGNADVLWEIKKGTWYGWPDFSAGEPMNTGDYKTPHHDPEFILSEHPNRPPKPTAILAVHSSSNGFDFSKNPSFGYSGQAFIAQFGDMAPNVGRVYGPVGFKVVRVDIKTGLVEDFAVNTGKTNGPGSEINKSGLERPVAARFDPSGNALYVVDFGIMTITEQGPSPKKNTGVIWKITRDGK